MILPEDNSGWLYRLSYIRNEADLSVVEELCCGRISACTPFFCEQLAQTAECTLKRAAKRFSRGIAECIEFGEECSLIVCFRRFRRDVERILKLSGIEGLDAEIARGLSESIMQNAQSVWKSAMCVLSAQAAEAHSAQLEDCVRQIKRLSLPE